MTPKFCYFKWKVTVAQLEKRLGTYEEDLGSNLTTRGIKFKVSLINFSLFIGPHVS